MKKNQLHRNIGNMVNVIIALLGVVLIVVGLLIASKCKNSCLETIFISIGTSILATAIVSFLTAHYLVKINAIKEIIEKWGLVNIYKSKSDMNVTSNQYLAKCKKNIDIMAIGMSGFLSAQNETLERLIAKGVEIRIISCNSPEQLAQREKDESFEGIHPSSGEFYNEVKILNDWVSKQQKGNSKVSIKYHNTYPAFSYLRIDGHAFWGPNLYLKQSQYCPAFEFSINDDEYSVFQQHFEKLWDSKMLTDVLDTSESKNEVHTQ